MYIQEMKERNRYFPHTRTATNLPEGLNAHPEMENQRYCIRVLHPTTGKIRYFTYFQ